MALAGTAVVDVHPILRRHNIHIYNGDIVDPSYVSITQDGTWMEQSMGGRSFVPDPLPSSCEVLVLKAGSLREARAYVDGEGVQSLGLWELAHYASMLIWNDDNGIDNVIAFGTEAVINGIRTYPIIGLNHNSGVLCLRGAREDIGVIEPKTVALISRVTVRH